MGHASRGGQGDTGLAWSEGVSDIYLFTAFLGLFGLFIGVFLRLLWLSLGVSGITFDFFPACFTDIRLASYHEMQATKHTILHLFCFVLGEDSSKSDAACRLHGLTIL